jgi:hypothetical protein
MDTKHDHPDNTDGTEQSSLEDSSTLTGNTIHRKKVRTVIDRTDADSRRIFRALDDDTVPDATGQAQAARTPDWTYIARSDAGVQLGEVSVARRGRRIVADDVLDVTIHTEQDVKRDSKQQYDIANDAASTSGGLRTIPMEEWDSSSSSMLSRMNRQTPGIAVSVQDIGTALQHCSHIDPEAVAQIPIETILLTRPDGVREQVVFASSQRITSLKSVRPITALIVVIVWAIMYGMYIHEIRIGIDILSIVFAVVALIVSLGYLIYIFRSISKSCHGEVQVTLVTDLRILIVRRGICTWSILLCDVDKIESTTLGFEYSVTISPVHKYTVYPEISAQYLDHIACKKIQQHRTVELDSAAQVSKLSTLLELLRRSRTWEVYYPPMGSDDADLDADADSDFHGIDLDDADEEDRDTKQSLLPPLLDAAPSYADSASVDGVAGNRHGSVSDNSTDWRSQVLTKASNEAHRHGHRDEIVLWHHSLPWWVAWYHNLSHRVLLFVVCVVLPIAMAAGLTGGYTLCVLGFVVIFEISRVSRQEIHIVTDRGVVRARRGMWCCTLKTQSMYDGVQRLPHAFVFPMVQYEIGRTWKPCWTWFDCLGAITGVTTHYATLHFPARLDILVPEDEIKKVLDIIHSSYLQHLSMVHQQ